MYDVELFPNIFAEGEILCMDREFFESLKKLLDDKMSVRLLQFIERFEESGIRRKVDDPIAVALCKQVDLMQEVLGPTIRSNTFHLEVLEAKLLDFTSQLNIDTALLVIQNRKQAIKDLTWLLKNRRYWQSSIAARQKADYEDFLAKCESLMFATRSLDYSLREAGMSQGIRHYDNLMVRVKSNKEFFYSPNEKKRATRMGNIMNIVNTIEIILHGLKYQEKCNELEIPKLARRSFRA